MVEYTKKILKSNDTPQPPQVPSSISFRFHDKTRDKFLELLNESCNRGHWKKPILTEEEEKKASMQQLGPKTTGSTYTGIGAIKKQKQQ